MTDAEARKVAWLIGQLPVEESVGRKICVDMNRVCETHVFTVAFDGAFVWRVVVDAVGMEEPS